MPSRLRTATVESGSPSPLFSPGEIVLAQGKDVSLQEAQQSSGMHIREPSWPGLTLARVQQIASVVAGAPPVLGTVLLYRENTSNRWLVLKQTLSFIFKSIKYPSAVDGYVAAHPSAVRTTVAGHAAAFLAHSIPAPGLPGKQLQLGTALWEQGDFVIEIEGSGLSLQEADSIGGSLHEGVWHRRRQGSPGGQSKHDLTIRLTSAETASR